jgi:hypothetical protein
VKIVAPIIMATAPFESFDWLSMNEWRTAAVNRVTGGHWSAEIRASVTKKLAEAADEEVGATRTDEAEDKVLRKQSSKSGGIGSLRFRLLSGRVSPES